MLDVKQVQKDEENFNQIQYQDTKYELIINDEG